MVHRLGYRFRLHKHDLPGTPDLVLPRHRAVIFVNGCFWHWHPDPNCPIAGLPKSNLEYWTPKLERTRVHDQQNVASLQAIHWRVLVIWECELKSPEDVLAQIHEFLSANHDPKRSYQTELAEGEMADKDTTKSKPKFSDAASRSHKQVVSLIGTSRPPPQVPLEQPQDQMRTRCLSLEALSYWAYARSDTTT